MKITPKTIKSKVRIPNIGTVEIEEINPLLRTQIELMAKRSSTNIGLTKRNTLKWKN